MSTLSDQEPAIHRRRHALLIELGGSEALRALAADTFDMVTVTDWAGALDALADHDDISVALIDDCVDENVNALLESLTLDEPSLPVIIVAPSKRELARVTLGTDVDGVELESALEGLPELGGYGAGIVDAFSSAVTDSITEGFLPSASVTGAFYKSNRRHLSDVNAVLHFEGGSFSGWVCVAADHQLLRAIFGELFAGATSTDAELEDLAGELSNHVVARLRRWLPDSRPRIVSVPEIMRGKDELMRKTRTRHTLALEVTTPHGPMYAQLHFAADAPIEISAEPQAREAFQMF